MYYFGYTENRGHELIDANNRRCLEHNLPKDFPVRIHALDSGLLPPNSPQIEGRLYHWTMGDWNIISFWDRSGDKRPGSNSAFITKHQGYYSTEEFIKDAKEMFPQLFQRFNFELK